MLNVASVEAGLIDIRPKSAFVKIHILSKEHESTLTKWLPPPALLFMIDQPTMNIRFNPSFLNFSSRFNLNDLQEITLIKQVVFGNI